jgi:hypothetical protein
VDGFFYDIGFFPKGACWSPESQKFREKHDLLDDSLAGHERFWAKAQETFSKRFWDVIQGTRPESTVFSRLLEDAGGVPIDKEDARILEAAPGHLKTPLPEAPTAKFRMLSRCRRQI